MNRIVMYLSDTEYDELCDVVRAGISRGIFPNFTDDTVRRICDDADVEDVGESGEEG